MIRITGRSRLWPAAMLVTFMAMGCESTTDEGDHPGEDVAELRVTIGSQTLSFGPSGTTGSYDLDILNHAVSIVALDANGQVLALPTDGDLVLQIVSNHGNVTFTRFTPFTGTLGIRAPGLATLEVSLQHDGHNEFGPHPVGLRMN